MPSQVCRTLSYHHPYNIETDTYFVAKFLSRYLDVVLHDPKEDVCTASAAALELMRRVKARFDPARTCNPGVFVGGI